MPAGSTQGIDEYLHYLWDHGGTDLLVTAGSPPLVKIDGVLSAIPDASVLHPDDCDRVVASLLSERQLNEFRASRDLDMSFNWEGKARFRANVFVQRGSTALALRLIPYDIPSMESLRLPESARRFADLPQGLVLVTGPTGSGKSTTLAAMIDTINERRACHILTIEDPIEYVHRHKRSAVNQREIGNDTESFQRALRSALREDPEVLLVGEMRDLETMRIALTIAETGHLVFATLHTNDTAQALDRIVDVFPAEYQTQVRVQLANSLAGIVYQQLLPRAEGGGRVAAFEVLVATHPVRNLIKEGKTRQIRNVVATGQQDGMVTFEASLSALVAGGEITYDDAVARSLHPGEILLPRTGPVEVPARGRRRRA